MGIMASFSIAKKVAQSEIESYFEKCKKAGKKDKEIGKILQEKIVKDIHDAIMKNKIPGLLQPQELAKEAGVDQKVIDKMPELDNLSGMISHKISEKKYDKMSLCYLVNSLVNLLGLTEEDFEKFHQNNNDDDDDDEGLEDA
jgi:hypothetical protein